MVIYATFTQAKDAEKLHCGKVHLWGDLEQIKDFVSQFSILSVENAAGSQLIVEGSSSIVFWISFRKKNDLHLFNEQLLFVLKRLWVTLKPF